MQQTKLKMWVGVGSYLMAGAATVLVASQSYAADYSKAAAKPTATTATAAKAPAGEGAEGGEGGEAKAKFKNKVTNKQLLAGLREGGYVIYIRHTQTTKDYADQADPKMDLSNCDTQRKLSTKGVTQAKNIGLAFTKANIPVGDVLASDYCRAWKAADLAFGRHVKTPALNFAKAEKYTDEQKRQMSDAVTPLLVALPKPKTNTVIVGHDDVFDAATGIYPEPQGMAYILKPDGNGKFEILANMKAEGWVALAKTDMAKSNTVK